MLILISLSLYYDSGYMDSHQSRVRNGDKCSANGSLSNGGVITHIYHVQ